MHNSDSTTPGGNPPPPGAQPQEAGATPEGAPPCNTAPAKCIPGGVVQILGQGIDSLYLSYPGQINLESEIKLQVAKETAQARNPGDKALSVFALGNHRFEVLGKGAGYYPYVLVDNAYRIKLSSSQAQRLPLAYIQLYSQWLLGMGIEAAVRELDKLLAAVGILEDEAQVSRADLFVDFSTSMPLDTISIGQWISRARAIHTYTINREFTGYTIGQGGDLSARLYDKTAEILGSGKIYLRPLWKNKGWNGEDKVYRLEFQIERRILVEHEAKTVPVLLEKLGRLWRYATLSWLKLVMPSATDTTQSRWPLHPVWQALADLDWPNTIDGVSIPFHASRRPSARFLYENGVSGITSFMACEGITDPLLAFDAYYDSVKRYHNERGHFTGVDLSGYMREKAAQKAKRYNLVYPGVDERLAEKVRPVYARAYRKLKDGE